MPILCLSLSFKFWFYTQDKTLVDSGIDFWEIRMSPGLRRMLCPSQEINQVPSRVFPTLPRVLFSLPTMEFWRKKKALELDLLFKKWSKLNSISTHKACCIGPNCMQIFKIKAALEQVKSQSWWQRDWAANQRWVHRSFPQKTSRRFSNDLCVRQIKGMRHGFFSGKKL